MFGSRFRTREPRFRYLQATAAVDIGPRSIEHNLRRSAGGGEPHPLIGGFPGGLRAPLAVSDGVGRRGSRRSNPVNGDIAAQPGRAHFQVISSSFRKVQCTTTTPTVPPPIASCATAQPHRPAAWADFRRRIARRVFACLRTCSDCVTKTRIEDRRIESRQNPVADDRRGIGGKVRLASFHMRHPSARLILPLPVYASIKDRQPCRSTSRKPSLCFSHAATSTAPPRD